MPGRARAAVAAHAPRRRRRPPTAAALRRADGHVPGTGPRAPRPPRSRSGRTIGPVPPARPLAGLLSASFDGSQTSGRRQPIADGAGHTTTDGPEDPSVGGGALDGCPWRWTPGADIDGARRGACRPDARAASGRSEADGVLDEDDRDPTGQVATDDEDLVGCGVDAIRLEGTLVLERQDMLLEPGPCGIEIGHDLLAADHEHHLAGTA